MNHAGLLSGCGEPILGYTKAPESNGLINYPGIINPAAVHYIELNQYSFHLSLFSQEVVELWICRYRLYRFYIFELIVPDILAIVCVPEE